MAEGVKLEVSGFKSLNEQLGEAEDRVRNLVNQFGVGSREVQQAAQEAGKLKQQMMEADRAIESFTATGKFDALAGGIQGIVGGFAAVQGAMAIVGVESEDLEKTLVKVQGALALVEGVKGVTEFAKSFSTLKTVATNAFNGIKAAIGSTGVGLLIIGLGVAIQQLITYFDQLSEAELKNQKALQTTADSYDKFVRQIEAANALLKRETDLKIAQAELEGKSIEDVAKIRYEASLEESRLVIEQMEKLKSTQDSRRNLAIAQAKKEKKDVNEAKKKADADYALEYDKLNEQLYELENQRDIASINLQKQKKDRDQKASDDTKQRLKEERNNEKDALRDLLEARRQYAEERENNAVTSAQLRLKNDLVRLREERDQALQEENLTEKAKETIKETYRVKGLTRIQEGNEEIAKLEEERRQEALDKEKAHQDRLADLQQKRYDRGVKVVDEFFKYQQIDLENTLLSEEDYAKASEDLELKRLERQLKLAKDDGEDTVDLELQVAQKKRAIRNQNLQEEKDAMQAAIDFAFQSATQTVDIFGQAANTRLQNERIAIEARYRSEIEAAGNNAQAIADLEYQMALDMEKINEEQFQNEKTLNIARATISGAQAVLNAYSTGFAFGPQTAIAFAAIAAALTAAQIGVIASQQYQPAYIKAPGDIGGGAGSGSQYQEGGLLLGAGHDMGGVRTSLGELEGGEFVMNRRSTASFLPLLEQLNSLGNEGGPQMAQSQATPVIKTYVVASEMTNQQEANARISRLARF